MANSSTHYIYRGQEICTIEYLLELYKEHQSVWKVSNIIGGSGQTIYTILKLNNLNNVKKKENQELIDFILENYEDYRRNQKVKLISKIFNVSHILVSRIAKKYNLTSRSKNDLSIEIKESIAKNTSQSRKEYFKINEHPKGMLNKKHSIETKAELSKIVINRWKDPNSVFNTKEYRQKKSDYMSKFQSNRADVQNNFTKGKKGYYPSKCGKSIFMRSSWELNYACYLDLLIDKGLIHKWEYEVDTFWFEKIKRGTRSYKPDFKVFTSENEFEYHEVKGWMDDKSKTKLNRMRIYYPKINIILIGQKEYNRIKKEYSDFLVNWDKFIN
jgi:hypothetical protein